MKRQKRKYILLIIAFVIFLFSIVILCTAIEKTFLYGRADAVIVSVTTEEHVSGTAGDHYYYTESEIRCRYTVNDLEYRKTYTIKADYSGQEGKTITILYDRTKPYESVMESKSVKAFLYSIILTTGSIYYIVYDIRKWLSIRKQETEKKTNYPLK